MGIQTITQSLKAIIVATAACAPAALIVTQGLEPAYADTASATHTLTITMSGFKSQTGDARVAVFRGEAAFKGNDALDGKVASVDADTVTLSFELPAGEYGVKAFQDLDQDGKLDCWKVELTADNPWTVWIAKDQSIAPVVKAEIRYPDFTDIWERGE